MLVFCMQLLNFNKKVFVGLASTILMETVLATREAERTMVFFVRVVVVQINQTR